jgi:hypothetical protein
VGSSPTTECEFPQANEHSPCYTRIQKKTWNDMYPIDIVIFLIPNLFQHKPDNVMAVMFSLFLSPHMQCMWFPADPCAASVRQHSIQPGRLTIYLDRILIHRPIHKAISLCLLPVNIQSQIPKSQKLKPSTGRAKVNHTERHLCHARSIMYRPQPNPHLKICCWKINIPHQTLEAADENHKYQLSST